MAHVPAIGRNPRSAQRKQEFARMKVAELIVPSRRALGTSLKIGPLVVGAKIDPAQYAAQF